MLFGDAPDNRSSGTVMIGIPSSRQTSVQSMGAKGPSPRSARTAAAKRSAAALKPYGRLEAMRLLLLLNQVAERRRDYIFQRFGLLMSNILSAAQVCRDHRHRVGVLRCIRSEERRVGKECRSRGSPCKQRK